MGLAKATSCTTTGAATAPGTTWLWWSAATAPGRRSSARTPPTTTTPTGRWATAPRTTSTRACGRTGSSEPAGSSRGGQVPACPPRLHAPSGLEAGRQVEGEEVGAGLPAPHCHHVAGERDGTGARPRPGVVVVHHLERVPAGVEEHHQVADARAGGESPVGRVVVAGEDVAAVAQRARQPEQSVGRLARPAGGKSAKVPAVVGVLEQRVETGVDGEPPLLADDSAVRVSHPLGLLVLHPGHEHAGSGGYRAPRLDEEGEVRPPRLEHAADRRRVLIEAHLGAEVVGGGARRRRLAIRDGEPAAVAHCRRLLLLPGEPR